MNLKERGALNLREERKRKKEMNEVPLSNTNFRNYRLHCNELDKFTLFLAHQLAS